MPAYRAGTLGLEPDEDGRLSPPVRTTVLVPAVRRSLVALRKAAPRAYGWCRTAGAVRHWSRLCRPKAGSPSRPRRRGAGCTRSAECGSEPRWWPKTTPHSGWPAHPRVTLRFLPTYCPRANPIERAFGDVHDCCTRIHRRKRLLDLVADVEDHLRLNGPWKYKLSDLCYEPAVTVTVEHIAAEEHAKVAVRVYQSPVDRCSDEDMNHDDFRTAGQPRRKRRGISPAVTRSGSAHASQPTGVPPSGHPCASRHRASWRRTRIAHESGKHDGWQQIGKRR